ncbi:MAG: hypothetical protein IKD11_01540 [Oscillospiraceae bacterium]|nr:hypothetical protein [Oscillospiraceae bacterium]
MKKHESLASFSIENEERANGHALICGVDEAGAGPLMGPVPEHNFLQNRCIKLIINILALSAVSYKVCLFKHRKMP